MSDSKAVLGKYAHDAFACKLDIKVSHSEAFRKLVAESHKAAANTTAAPH